MIKRPYQQFTTPRQGCFLQSQPGHSVCSTRLGTTPRKDPGITLGSFKERHWLPAVYSFSVKQYSVYSVQCAELKSIGSLQCAAVCSVESATVCIVQCSGVCSMKSYIRHEDFRSDFVRSSVTLMLPPPGLR